MEDQDGDWIKNARQEGFSNDGNQFDPTNAFAFDYPLQFDNSMIPREFATSNTIFNTATLPDDFLQFINEQQQQSLSTYEQGSLLPSSTVFKTPETGTPQLGQKRSREDSATDDAAKESDDEPSNQTMYILIVGGRTFRVSWESLKSDGPDNFFTMFFRKRKSTRLMHIDRDPDTFALVVHHLRGYYVQPRDDVQNQALLNDAQYYGLKRLRKILEEYLFLNVGGRIFRLPWSLLRKDGGSRNFFTGPVMHNVFSPHGHPSPIYIDRDPNTFADIISHLRGYTIHIRDEVHRKNLLKDAQYYALKQLRDKLMTSRRTLDGFGDRGHPEVLLLLQDVRPINLLPPREPIQYKDIMTCHEWSMSQLRYKRDDTPHALLVQISDFVLQAHNAGCTLTLTAEFAETQRAKLRDIAKETNASTEVDSRAYLDEACAMTIDDRQVRHLDTFELDLWEQCRCHTEGCCKVLKLGVQRAIAGVHIIDNKVALCIVRFVAISSRFQLNMKREFLPEG